MMNRIVTSIQQIVASLAETPSLFYYWYIYFLYSPLFLHNKLMLSTYITTYFPSKHNVWQYLYKQGWTKKKIVCSFVYFTQLCICISNKMHCFPAHISAKHNICRLISMVLSMLAHSLNPHSKYLTATPLALIIPKMHLKYYQL